MSESVHFTMPALKLCASDQQRLSAPRFGAPNPGSLALVIDVVFQCLTSPVSPTVLPSQSIYLTTNVDPSCSFMPLSFLPLLLVTRLPRLSPPRPSVRALLLLFTFSDLFTLSSFYAAVHPFCCPIFHVLDGLISRRLGLLLSSLSLPHSPEMCAVRRTTK
jgi:hypothetical protein